MKKKLIPKHSQKTNGKYTKQHTSDKYILNNPIKTLGNVKQYGPGGWFDDVKNVMKSMARTLVDKEARRAEVYDSNKYTFDLAYSDARSKGLRTFFWDNKYYNTDYSGAHHKKYEEDVKSGKAEAWEKQYPNFTHPELRKAKLEELDTYGITNELTKNATLKEKTFVKVPARGYDIDPAISAIKGEVHTYSKYENPEDLKRALDLKYRKFKDAPIEIVKNQKNPRYYSFKWDYDILDEYMESKNLTEKEEQLYYSYLNDLEALKYDKELSNEIHRNEYNLYLGYPYSDESMLNTPIISKYKSGNSPFAYTTKELELSEPFMDSRLYNAVEKQKLYEELKNRLREELRKQYNIPEMPHDEDFDTWGEFLTAYYDWAALMDSKLNIINKNVEKKMPLDYRDYDSAKKELISKINKSKDSIKYYKNLGITEEDGYLYLDDSKYKSVKSLIDKLSKEDLTLLVQSGLLLPTKDIGELKEGWHSMTTGGDYYTLNKDYYDSKYTAPVKKFLKIIGKEPSLNSYNPNAILGPRYGINDETLGSYSSYLPEDKSYMLINDTFDINPFGSGADEPLIEVGKPFEYFTRIYRNEPNIDSLYYNFIYKKGGCISNNHNNLTDKVKKKLIKKRK